jgi:hypothetical protein
VGILSLFRGDSNPSVVVVEAAIQPSLATDTELLSDINLERAAEVCRSLVRRNPTARRLIRLDIDYVVGSEVTFQVILPDDDGTKQEAMQAALDRWCTTCKVNSRFWQDLFRRYLTDGEIGVKFVKAPGNTMRPVIVATVGMRAEVDADSGDVVALVKSDMGRDFRYTIINSLTADPGKADDYLLYFRHDASGSVEGGERGNAELVPLVTRLQHEDEVSKLEVSRAKAMLRYFWHVIVKGASLDELKRLQKEYAQAPATGTVRYTNEHTEYKGISPELQAYETSRVLQDVRIGIASGAGVPVHFLGEGGDANLATATAMNTPAHRHFRRLQGEFSEMVDALLRYVLEQLLHFEVPLEMVFDLTLPEMDAEDQVSATQTLVQAVAAVQSLVDGSFITHAAGQRILATTIEQTVGVDLADEDLPDEPEEDPYADNPPPVPGEEGEEPPPEE